MKYLILTVIFVVAFAHVRSQTMIEMLHPEQADIVLCEVRDSSFADVVVYKTQSGKYADEWNLRWKFKKWGFANFAVYITDDPFCDELVDEDTGQRRRVDAFVYFTPNCEEAMYRHPSFMINGMMRVQRRLYLPAK